MKIETILLQNWQLKCSGGIHRESFESFLNKEQKECIVDWFGNALLQTRSDIPIPSLKHCIDVASWCRFGTDSLAEMSFELRRHGIELAAREFQIPENVLIFLITSTLRLEKCLESAS